MKSTATKYGTVAITIHWLSALLIFILLASGFRAASMTGGTLKELILLVHVPVGITILLLTIVRVAWWTFADSKPGSQPNSPGWQSISAKAVHLLFYVVVIGMAASGLGMLVLSGAGSVLFEGSDAPLPNFSDYAPRVPHGIGARLMVALLVIHIGAALYHQFVKKDGLLNRMWFGAG